MPQYLVCNYMPDDFDPSTVTEEMMEQIHALNREMIAAGVRKFACGIAPPASAKTLRARSDARCSSPMGRAPRPRSTWADSGYPNAPIWTRRSHGRRRVPSSGCGRRGARASSFGSGVSGIVSSTATSRRTVGMNADLKGHGSGNPLGRVPQNAHEWQGFTP